MIVDGEKAIVTAIQDAFAYFRQNVSVLVPMIYPNESAQNQADIASWWGSAQNQVYVQVGYLLQPIAAPQVAVTIEEEQEGQQFAGGERAGLVVAVGSNVADVDAAYMQTAYGCHITGINQNFVLWQQILVKWALFFKRKSLQQETQADGTITGVFQRQRLSAGPFRPVPSEVLHEGIFPYERTVTLTATHMNTWAGEGVPAMESGGVTVIEV